ncbi:COBRA-like protein [Striga asiatica]|uniref:COBRA-like protein n=1 Tax=Striga asiatica TaxID=4170 RepID=A0A5A7PAS6_STRAF|nr:COBRA-like protein [Striga asiatica]
MRRSIPLLFLRRWKDLPADLALRSSPTALLVQSSFTVHNNDTHEFLVGFRQVSTRRISGIGHECHGSSTSGPVGNVSVFAEFPNPDLETGIETAGDSTQMAGWVELVDTQIEVVPLDVPMPANISLVNDGWICPRPRMQGELLLHDFGSWECIDIASGNNASVLHERCWFTAVELNQGALGFEAAYSFNATSMGLGVGGENDTIFIQRLPAVMEKLSNGVTSEKIERMCSIKGDRNLRHIMEVDTNPPPATMIRGLVLVVIYWSYMKLPVEEEICENDVCDVGEDNVGEHNEWLMKYGSPVQNLEEVHFQSGLRALVKTGYGARAIPHVDESVVVDAACYRLEVVDELLNGCTHVAFPNHRTCSRAPPLTGWPTPAWHVSPSSSKTQSPIYNPILLLTKLPHNRLVMSFILPWIHRGSSNSMSLKNEQSLDHRNRVQFPIHRHMK